MIALLLSWNGLLPSSHNFAALNQGLLAASTKGLQAALFSFGLAVMVTALGCGLYFLARYQQGMSLDDAHSLFRELCRAHDLAGSERRLIKRLATGLGLSCPSALFIDSSLWRLPDGSNRHQRLSKAEWDKLLKLQRTLFLPPPAKILP